MSLSGPSFLVEQLALADALLHGGATMLEPQDLPGRYGRVVRAVDRVLSAVGAMGVVAGGWAVWRHGYVGRVTQDVDVVLSAHCLEEFLRVAASAGFEVYPRATGRWPKLRHRETDVQLDILPEGERPGAPPELAPTTIPGPAKLGAIGTSLGYVRLASLIELKLAAARLKDLADVVELIRANPGRLAEVRRHLSEVCQRYVADFDRLVEQARRDGEAR
jgi:hypothetical protein